MNYENDPLMGLNIQIEKNAVAVHCQQLAVTTVKIKKNRVIVPSANTPSGK